MTIGIVTVSDSRSWESDRGGPAVVEALRAQGFGHFELRLVRDDIAEIQAALIELCPQCHAVFTTGGTGFSPRDVTPEATAPLLERQADSLTELMRLKGLEHTPLSHLSRAVAGVRGHTLVVNLPGSPNGAKEGIEAIGSLLGPILESLRGNT